MRPILLLVVAVNPAAVAVALWDRERWRPVAAAAAVTATVVVVLAALSGPLLDALDVSPPSFQVATALVVGLSAARTLAAGTPRVAGEGPPSGWGRVLSPLLFPVLLTPAVVVAGISTATIDGLGLAIAGTIVGLGLAATAAVVAKGRDLPWVAAMRFVAALAIVLAIALAVDGVKTI